MKRFVLFFVLMLVFVCVSASADVAYVLCKPSDYVNVREHPSSRSKQAGILDCGDEVRTEWETKKDNHGGTWIRVYGFEGDAWVSARYLSDTPVTIADADCHAYVSANGRTAIRRAPNGKRTAWVKNGDELNVLVIGDEWILTTMGYVKAECVEVYYGRVE